MARASVFQCSHTQYHVFSSDVAAAGTLHKGAPHAHTLPIPALTKGLLMPISVVP